MNIENQLKKVQNDEKRLSKGPNRLSVLLRISIFFLPLSILISCLLVVLTVAGVPSAVKSVYGVASVLFPASTQLHQSADTPLFKDVSPGMPYFEAVQFLNKFGVLKGYDDGTFRPEDKITRADFVSSAIDTSDVFPLSLTYNKCFSDVNSQDFAPDVCFAKDKGWVTADSRNRFRPNDSVSMAEALKVLDYAFDLHLVEGVKLQKYSDVYSDDWFYDYVNIALSNGILDPGSTGDKLNPENPISRGQAAELIYRFLKLIK